MLKKMIMINSANFEIAEIDLSKEVQFVGENTSGKTTTTRALHYCYNANGDKLGIPAQKDSFAKHYFQHDDSYIIYCYEGFFVFTYKKGGIIQRYFSKQDFKLDRIIQNGKLIPFEEIRRYIKESLYFKPDSIAQYVETLYGGNRNKSDFSIAKIDNYNVFLEVYNMVFNVDRAIVDTKSIKNAIQKSLNRNESALKFDFNEHNRRLQKFSNDYSFFSVFDANRSKIEKALSIKSSLIELEQKKSVLLKRMNHRYAIEKELVEEYGENEHAMKKLLCANKKKIDIRKKKREETTLPYFRRKESVLLVNIDKLEELSEIYSPENYEENALVASTYERVDKEFRSKNGQLEALLTEQSSVVNVINKQIDDLENQIKTDIPREIESKIYKLFTSEQNMHDSEKSDIESEFSIEEKKLEDRKDIIENEKAKLIGKRGSAEEQSRVNIRELDETLDNNQKQIRNKISLAESTARELKRKIEETNDEKTALKRQQTELTNSYRNRRINDVKDLLEKRRKLNKNIKSVQLHIEKKPGSFKEYLSENIDNWEREVYPIIDKDLLSMDTSDLDPSLTRNSDIFGIKLNKKHLKSIPTPDEAKEIIQKLRNEKYENFHFHKEQARANFSVFEESLNALAILIEEKESLITTLIGKIGEEKKTQEALESQYKNLQTEYNQNKQKIRDDLLLILKTLNEKIEELERNKNDIEKEKRELIRNKNEDIQKSLEKLNSNKKSISASMEKEKLKMINSVKFKIKELEEKKEAMGDDEAISALQKDVSKLDKERTSCLRAIDFLDEYEKEKDKIATLPALKFEKESINNFVNKLNTKLKESIESLEEARGKIKTEIEDAEKENRRYVEGIRRFKELNLPLIEEVIETGDPLQTLVASFLDISSSHRDDMSRLRTLLNRISDLAKYPTLELNLDTRIFDEIESVQEADMIIESLDEISNFMEYRYDSIKKGSHIDFINYLRNTLPGNLTSFHDLESDFKKTIGRINRNLAYANFGAIRDIRLNIEDSNVHNDSIGGLLEELGEKAVECRELYDKDSLFQDIPRSVENIDKINDILKKIQKKSHEGEINLYDTIDLSISFVENGKKNENLKQIKDDSSSGGRILLKVAIAISILNLYINKSLDNSPFYLIIDEISRLQAKNQKLLKQYINENGFKTLFITPDPSYPDPKESIFYTFKNIINEGDSLEVTQVNFV